jgi:uncharacterized protein (TIGR03435 family)
MLLEMQHRLPVISPTGPSWRERHMMDILLGLVFVASLPALHAQNKPAPPVPVYEFDALSLKADQATRSPGPAEFSAAAADASRIKGGPGTADPERITATGITFQGLITAAYGVRNEQVSGPGWISDSKYVLEAKVPPGATREQMKLMLQKALADRFKLVLHRQQKDLPAWELTIVKDGSKLKPAADQSAAPQMKFEVRSGVRYDTYTAFRISKTDPSESGVSLDAILSQYLAAIGMAPAGTTPNIADKTGMTGKYDINLEYSVPRRDGSEASGLDLIAALEKQLGLRLEQKKTATDVLIIDRVEKVPTNN